jgi:hypothetical protein
LQTGAWGNATAMFNTEDNIKENESNRDEILDDSEPSFYKDSSQQTLENGIQDTHSSQNHNEDIS